MHKIVSGRAPIYISIKLLINQSWRNSSRKLNVSVPRLDLFKSSLVYSGPALWNSLFSELRLPVSPSVFKKRLAFHVISLRCYVKPWSQISLSMCCFRPVLCCFRQSIHFFVSVLYVHVVFDDKHVLMRVRTCVCLPQIVHLFVCLSGPCPDDNYLLNCFNFCNQARRDGLSSWVSRCHV